MLQCRRQRRRDVLGCSRLVVDVTPRGNNFLTTRMVHGDAAHWTVDQWHWNWSRRWQRLPRARQYAITLAPRCLMGPRQCAASARVRLGHHASTTTRSQRCHPVGEAATAAAVASEMIEARSSQSGLNRLSIRNSLCTRRRAALLSFVCQGFSRANAHASKMHFCQLFSL